MGVKKVILAITLATLPAAARAQVVTGADCPGCKSGEYGATAVQSVGHGDYVYEADPSCSSDMNQQMAALGEAYATSQGAAAYAGPIYGAIATAAGQVVKDHIYGSVGQFLSQWTNPSANCQLIAVAIPRKAKYVGYRLEAKEAGEGTWHPCAVNGGCLEGWCKFTQEPYNNNGVVATIFKNWSHNRERNIRLTAYFVPEDNSWAPPR
jgi:hypothetical protein